MADDKADAKKWTFTAPKDGEACWSDLKAFSDNACAKADAEAKVVAAMKLGAEETTVGWKLKTCEEKKLVIGTGDKFATDVTVDLSKATVADGKVKCHEWTTGKTWVSVTLSGWSDGSAKTDANATGAKSLAAAVAAGALAVAATQF
jgi:hypothetical protein